MKDNWSNFSIVMRNFERNSFIVLQQIVLKWLISNNVIHLAEIEATDSITDGARGLLGKKGIPQCAKVFFSFK